MLQNDQNQLDYAMLPFVMRDLVNMVMKKKMLLNCGIQAHYHFMKH